MGGFWGLTQTLLCPNCTVPAPNLDGSSCPQAVLPRAEGTELVLQSLRAWCCGRKVLAQCSPVTLGRVSVPSGPRGSHLDRSPGVLSEPGGSRAGPARRDLGAAAPSAAAGP